MGRRRRKQKDPLALNDRAERLVKIVPCDVLRGAKRIQSGFDLNEGRLNPCVGLGERPMPSMRAVELIERLQVPHDLTQRSKVHEIDGLAIGLDHGGRVGRLLVGRQALRLAVQQAHHRLMGKA